MIIWPEIRLFNWLRTIWHRKCWKNCRKRYPSKQPIWEGFARRRLAWQMYRSGRDAKFSLSENQLLCFPKSQKPISIFPRRENWKVRSFKYLDHQAAGGTKIGTAPQRSTPVETNSCTATCSRATSSHGDNCHLPHRQHHRESLSPHSLVRFPWFSDRVVCAIAFHSLPERMNSV